MEIDDNQAGSFTLDATFSDPEFSYDRQADDSMGFSSTVNSPPTAIEDSVGLYCAKVCIPPFTKGRKQLTRHEVDWSREISHVRVLCGTCYWPIKKEVHCTSKCDSYHFIKK